MPICLPPSTANMSMDIDAPVSINTGTSSTLTTILCCNCGAPIDGTKAAGALCYDCVRLTVDASEGIPREATIHTCRDCDRWFQPPGQWISAAPESRELLALCLRKLRGLSKVRIIDANFLWTEPHSRRVKVKLTVQQDFQGAIVQQSFEVEYVVAYQQCPDCMKSFTANVWRAVVQVRQKVPHKRTFLYLEQLILKHSAHRDAINIKEAKEGLDFFFSQRNHAEKFVDFLNSVVPMRTKKSQELISMDIHTSSKSYKFSFSCELIPICKDDLVALPIKLAKQIGNISPLALCYRVGTSVNIMDPSTLQTADIGTNTYWRAPFGPLADASELVEFVIMDIEPLGVQKGRYFLAEATVARSSDLGVNDTTFYTRTHLGGFLHPGDTAMGYHISRTNFNNPNFEAIEEHSSLASRIPDVVLVKKSYIRKKKANKGRNWRLKRMNKVEEEAPHGRKQDQERMENDFEMFLRDVEEDNELRSTLDLYKAQKKAQNNAMEIETTSIAGTDQSGDGDEDMPKIDVSELLEDFEEMGLEDKQ